MKVNYKWPSDLNAMLFSLFSGIAIVWPSAHTDFFWKQPYSNLWWSSDSQTWIFLASAAFGLCIFPFITNLLSKKGLSWWFVFPIVMWFAGGLYWVQDLRYAGYQADQIRIILDYCFYALLLNLALSGVIRYVRYDRRLLAQQASYEVNQDDSEGIWPPPPQSQTPI